MKQHITKTQLNKLRKLYSMWIAEAAFKAFTESGIPPEMFFDYVEENYDKYSKIFIDKINKGDIK